jgi:flavin reductase (DIM6/NTAB) family NADH-FMN oxidoreductase RutF
MAKTQLRFDNALYPTPVVLVTSAGSDGIPNVMTASWVGILNSDPSYVYISIDESRHSCTLIKETGEFVINLVDESMVRCLDQCGMSSGKEGSKCSRLGLTLTPASQVKAPLILEAKVHLECRTRQFIEIGSQQVFVSEVLSTQADESVLDSNGHLDNTKLKPVAYIGHEYWGISGLLGKYGFTDKG